MEYEVVIDLGSKYYQVEAKNEEEAKAKAIKEFEALPDCDKIEEYWVGDVSKVN